jgi:recombination protein RecA
MYETKEREQRAKQLNLAIDRMNKAYGPGTVMSLGEKPQSIDVVSSGSLSLDIALGVGGFPRGRIIEIYGPESSGKTTLAIHAIAECQKMGGNAAIIDAEHAFDSFYASCLGVDIDALKISQPDNGEQALEIAENLIKSGGLDIIVIDSVAALVPKSEIDGEMGDSKMGVHARLMSQAMRKMIGFVNKTQCCVIFINQLRDKIGITFGSPEVTTGGNALKFYATIRLDIRKVAGAPISDRDGNAVANHVKVKVIKNKVAPPFKVAEFDIVFGEGISKMGEILDMGSDMQIIDKSGAWYSYEGTKMAQGREGAIGFLKDNPELAEEIEKKIRDRT